MKSSLPGFVPQTWNVSPNARRVQSFGICVKGFDHRNATEDHDSVDEERLLKSRGSNQILSLHCRDLLFVREKIRFVS
jgi:hypothetical protein